MSPLIGLSGIVYALYYIFTHHSAGFNGYFDVPSIVLVGLCPPCVMLLSHSLRDFGTGISTLIRAAVGGQSSAQNEVISVLTNASAMIRSQGLGSLMSIKDKIRYELMRDGITLIINNFTPEEIRHNLSAKINAKQTRMALASNLFENMAKVSPGTGMLGTLLGLINMMSHLADPTKIGGGMALALITTLYGLILATFIYAPSAEKISLEAEKTLEIDTMVLEGILGLKSKKSSVHMRDIMKTYGRQSEGTQTNRQRAG